MLSGKKEVINILVRRDGITVEEAKEILTECMEEVQSAIEYGYSTDEVWDIFADYTGLEPDYLLDILI